MTEIVTGLEPGVTTEFDWDGGLLRHDRGAGYGEWEQIPGPLLSASPSARATAEAASAEAETARATIDSLRSDTTTRLTDALALRDLYPAPTPEETAIIDGQVAEALAAYTALSDPPADVVALAAKVVAWRTGVAL